MKSDGVAEQDRDSTCEVLRSAKLSPLAAGRFMAGRWALTVAIPLACIAGLETVLASSAAAQVSEGAVWLDSGVLKVGVRRVVNPTLVNPTSNPVKVQVETEGDIDLTPIEETGDITIPPGGSVRIRLRAGSETGAGTLIAWGIDTFTTRPFVVTGPSLPTIFLPSSLATAATTDPIGDVAEDVKLKLPHGLAQPSGDSCAGSTPGVLVGRLSGPNAQLADACASNTTLYVAGAKEPGTWSGKIDLLPADDKAGTIDISVTVRDSWPLPLLTLVAGLLGAMIPLLLAFQRDRFAIRHQAHRAIERVTDDYTAKLEAVKGLYDGELATGLDRVSDPSARPSLRLDWQVANFLADVRLTLTKQERDAFLLPAGGRATALEGLVTAVLDHHAILLRHATVASAIRKRTDEILPPNERPANTPLLDKALRRQERRVVTSADWTDAQGDASQLTTQLNTVQELLELIEHLGPPLQFELLRDLLEAGDDAALKAVRDAIHKVPELDEAFAGAG
jgi:hypothetical protein